ncbi:MAG: hypothetical protein HY315_00810 [Acidobacteria bacterium]|nr:hypothetical protein [Acidobacteriota bacterium]
MNKATSCAGKAARTLIYIPIIHTETDMGNFGDFIRRVKLRKLGRKGWERTASVVDQLWAEIERAIDSLPLSYNKVHIYQDGLPVCDRELDIVTELAKAGSRNHLLLLRLKERGAHIMGTESSELLVEEYGLIKAASNASVKPVAIKHRQRTLGNSLLQRRDRYIAERINNTLRHGQTGILFLGMAHSPQRWLYKDIQVNYPVGRPRDRRGTHHDNHDRYQRQDSNR